MQVYVPPAAASASSDTSASKASTSAKSSTLNYDAFLKLLVAEMKAQDPTKPADTAAYMGQLASFSSVEQGIKTNTKLDQLMTSMSLGQSGSLIGHSIISADGSVSGIVKSIEIYSDGTLAVLDSGTKVELAAGVKIS